ncbi:hypothetical protein ZWY2020_034098 [Hordeum vulgare]|nr:hypothetical protein ZWY2020_034098 [Hordeum vulgare]
MIIEVMQWLPVKSVFRFKAVCRSWAALLSSDEFRRLHMAAAKAAKRRAPPAKLLYISPTTTFDSTAVYSCSFSRSSSSDRPRDRGDLLFTIDGARGNYMEVVTPAPCHGLTLLYDALDTAYYICNAATRAATRLPPSADEASSSAAGLGFDARTNEHKVVRLINGMLNQKNLDPHSIPPLPVNDMPPAYVKGMLYWMNEPRLGQSCEWAIVSFNLATDPVADKLDVWKLELDQWGRAYTIHLEACPGYSLKTSVVVPLAVDPDHGRILLNTGRKIGLYDPVEQTIENLYSLDQVPVASSAHLKFLDMPSTSSGDSLMCSKEESVVETNKIDSKLIRSVPMLYEESLACYSFVRKANCLWV